MNRLEKPLFQDINPEDPEISQIESLCLNCGQNGNTRVFLTKIPYYKEIILMSFDCDHCGFTNNETQFGGSFQEKGILIKLHVQNEKDLNRQVIKSDYANVSIPELELEIPSQSQKGEITTVEGILQRVISGLEQDQEKRKKTDPKAAEKISEFLRKIYKKKSLQESFYLIIKDPSGNSFVENPNAPQKDDQLEITHYKRSKHDDVCLGIVEARSEPINEDLVPSDEIATFSTICHICNSPCETNMKPTKIPHFKEVVIMATNCEVCGHRTNEVKSGSGIEPLGTRITVHIANSRDLTRDVLKSETCKISIPDLELEVGAGALGGRFTTVEGLIDNIKEQLTESNCMLYGDSSDTEKQKKMEAFLQKLDQIKNGTRKVCLILDDPAGNSFIQNLYTPQADPQLEVIRYERTYEQNDELGLNDMKTENYETH